MVRMWKHLGAADVTDHVKPYAMHGVSASAGHVLLPMAHMCCLCRAGGGYPHPLQVHYLLSSSYGDDTSTSVSFVAREGESKFAQHM